MKLFYFIPDLFTSYDYEKQWKDFLRNLRDLGVTGFRIFLQYSWPPYETGKANVLSPYKQIGYWHADYDDSPLMPFYNALEFDEAWLEKLHSLKEFLLKEWPECELILTLHDYCSIKQDRWRKYFYPILSSSPWRSMEDPEYYRYHGGFWGLGDGSIEFLQREYIKKVSEIFSGLNYLLEFCNEDGLLDWDDDYANKYYRWLRSIIGDRLLISGRWSCIQPETFYSQHGIIEPASPLELPPISPEYVIPSGDGAEGGDGPADQLGRRGLGFSMIPRLVYWLNVKGFYGYEFMDRGIWGKDDNRAVLADADFDLLKALSKEMGLYKEPIIKVKMVVCSESGMVPTKCCPLVVEEAFFIGDEPRELCPFHYPVEIDVCKKSGKIATKWCRETYHVNCSQYVFSEEYCDECSVPCCFWLKLKNFKRYFKCLLRRLKNLFRR